MSIMQTNVRGLTAPSIASNVERVDITLKSATTRNSVRFVMKKDTRKDTRQDP